MILDALNHTKQDVEVDAMGIPRATPTVEKGRGSKESVGSAENFDIATPRGATSASRLDDPANVVHEMGFVDATGRLDLYGAAALACRCLN